MKPLRICLIEPFFGGSHQRWAEELQAKSRHQIELLTLPARHWKWRMHGAAVTLAQKLMGSSTRYDLFLATDMLDLNVFLSLVRHRHADTPVALYFHENQLSYPWSPRDEDLQKRRDLHYAFINYASALAADRVYFNSDYHRVDFLGTLGPFLNRYPDHQNKATVQTIAAKSETLPLGIDLRGLDRARGDGQCDNRVATDTPLLLWNHRWEYDKNPVGFCKLLMALRDRGTEFRVAVLGQRFEEEPVCFAELRRTLGERVVAYGNADSYHEYARWLWAADILPVTSRQDFFGGSVVEAIYCGCHPLLPNRLAYLDHFDPAIHPDCFYAGKTEAVEKLAQLIQSGRWREPCPLRDEVTRYDWSSVIETYDASFERCASSP